MPSEISKLAKIVDSAKEVLQSGERNTDPERNNAFGPSIVVDVDDYKALQAALEDFVHEKYGIDVEDFLSTRK